MYIEELLKEKSKIEGVTDYYSQWDFERKELKSILGSIKEYYPHYTLHGETHSIKILNNVIKILGKQVIEKFSTLDLWMLLKCAYVHDIGMYITSDRIESTINGAKFRNYLRRVQKNQKHPLSKYSQNFKIKNKKLHHKDTEYSLNKEYSFRYLIADFLRNEHADESKEIIKNTSKVGMSDIRLIPKRIDNMIGEIIAVHTKDFDEVLALPYKVDGIELEVGHPRFIACMLRLGDLLDLDNDRYSEVFLNNIKNTIPQDSLNHIDKHKAIELLSISKERIEITAKISKDKFPENAYTVASITRDWLEYIEEEIKNQMINWNNIVPSSDYGYLPTLGKLRVDLEGYDYISSNKVPKFTIDTENALELLKEAGAYSDHMLALRELIQNSIDATYIRMGMENGETLENIKPVINNEINYEEYENALSKYPIYIEAEKKEGKLRISIEDSGTGFSKETLSYLEKVSSSKNDFAKQEIINKLPLILKPSGNFGIGFQSIFMLTDNVKMKTTSIKDNMTYELKLESPSKGGNIYITSKSKEIEAKYGTVIEFLLKDEVQEKFPKRISSAILAENLRNNHFVDQGLCEVEGLKEHLVNNYKYIIVPLIFNGIRIISNKEKFNYYYKEEDLQVSHELMPMLPFDRKSYTGNVLFKNQQVVSYGGQMGAFNININILGREASEVLQINRSQIKHDFHLKLHELREKAMVEYIKNYIIKNKEYDDSMLYDISIGLVAIKNIKIKEKLKEIKVNFAGNECELLEVWKYNKILVYLDEKNEKIDYFDFLNKVDSVIMRHLNNELSVSPFFRSGLAIVIKDKKVEFKKNLSDYSFPEELKHLWLRQIYEDYYIESITSTGDFVLKKKREGYRYKINTLIEYVKRRRLAPLPQVAGLFVLPFDNNFKGLEYDFNSVVKCGGFQDFNVGKTMLAPYKINTNGELENLPKENYLELAYKSRVDQTITKEEIEREVNELYKTLES